MENIEKKKLLEEEEKAARGGRESANQLRESSNLRV